MECQDAASGPVSASPSPIDADDESLGRVECRAERMHQRVAQLAALMNRPRRLRRGVAGDPAREAETSEETAQTFLVERDLRVYLGVGALEERVGDHRRTAVAGSADVDRIDIALLDRPVHVGVDEVQAGNGPEMAEQSGLDVLRLQRLAQQRVVEQIDLPDGQVVRGAPVGVDLRELLLVERLCPRLSPGHSQSLAAEGN